MRYLVTASREGDPSNTQPMSRSTARTMPEAVWTQAINLTRLPLACNNNRPCPSRPGPSPSPPPSPSSFSSSAFRSQTGTLNRGISGDLCSAISAPPQPAYYTPSGPVQPSGPRALACSPRTTSSTATATTTLTTLLVGRERGGGAAGRTTSTRATSTIALASPTTATRPTNTKTASHLVGGKGRGVLPERPSCAASAPLQSGLLSPSRCSPCSSPSHPPASLPISLRWPAADWGRTTTMCQLLPAETTLRAVLGTVVAANVTIEKRRLVPSARIQRIYGVDLSDGGRLLLVTPPPSMMRLMRSEQWLVESEAAVVRWVRDVLTREKLAVNKVLNLDGATAPCSSSRTNPGRHPSAETPDYDEHQQQEKQHHYPLPPDLLALLPPLLFSSTTATTTTTDTATVTPALTPATITGAATAVSLESPYAVFGQPHTPSIPVAVLRQPLSTSERKTIDYQVGSLARQLSYLTAPARTFGPAVAILPSPDPPSSSSSSSNAIPQVPTPFGPMGIGAGTWSMAFHSILEGILRDAEDMAIIVPYGPIRKHFRRLGYILDTVTSPRLVLVDAGDYTNILVSASPSSTRPPNPPLPITDKLRTSFASSSSPLEPAGPMEITGLADWSNCVFGDPLFMRIFSEEPSVEFLRGFNGDKPSPKTATAYRQDRNDDDDYDDSVGNDEYYYHHNSSYDRSSNDLIEDREMSAIRLLLYQCYHFTVSIVREFYRPRAGSTDRERDARRKLTVVLGKLADVEDDPKRRHRRPSGDMSPAKKPKQDDSE